MTNDNDPRAQPAQTSISHLLVQVLGGVLIAGVVGGISVWGSQRTMDAQFEAMSEQIRDLRQDVREMRAYMYRNTSRTSQAMAPDILPAGRP